MPDAPDEADEDGAKRRRRRPSRRELQEWWQRVREPVTAAGMLLGLSDHKTAASAAVATKAAVVIVDWLLRR